MRKLLLSVLIVLSFFAISMEAQTSRIADLAEQLEQNIGELADRSANEFVGRTNNKKDDLENLLISRQLKATIETFQLLLTNKRPNSELRDVADSLNDLSRKFSDNSSNSSQWQPIKRDIEDLLRRLKESNAGNNEKDKDKKKEVLGKLQWQGTIDDEVHLLVSKGAVQIRTISGTEYVDGIFSFTSPLPDEEVQVFVNKKSGRGSAKVIQQPNSSNNFTAIIQVLDKNGGAKEYELEIYWTK